ncbi:MAG TPA: hypothetical protein ENK55_03715 [Actinobacteria bacterium]|nr:hypothetical protein [Actinomycetota bacterium]
MADIGDLPRLVVESYDLTKAYLVQETVEPAKRLGRFAGVSLGAALLWSVGLVLLAVAGVRTLIRFLPAGPYYEALGYLAGVVVLGVVGYLLVRFLAPRGATE